MKLMSVNVSLPAGIEDRGRNVSTGIFKAPVSGPVAVTRLNLDGDRQADLKNHGGEFKAVYAYSYDHYPYWREALNRADMPMGLFGENLTVLGLDETECCIGDHLEVGSALFTITQPRVPCFKLGIRLDDRDMPKQFIASGLTGFYLKVLKEGMIKTGDEVTIVGRDENRVPVKDLFDAYFNHSDLNSVTIFNSALQAADLSPEWRHKIEERLKL